MATNVRDPRSLITPDAFAVSEELLGTPLATPGRRFWALVVDVVVIASLSALTDSISLFIWGGVGLFLFSMAFRKSAKGRSDTAGLLFRGATGCLGVSILSVALLAGVGGALLSGLGDGDEAAPSSQEIGEALEAGDLSALAELGPLGGVVRRGGRALLAQAEDTVAARQAAVILLVAASSEQPDPSAWPEVLAAATPEDAPWIDDAETVHARAIAAAESQLESTDEVAPVLDARIDEVRVDSMRAEVATLDDQRLLSLWLELLRTGQPNGDPADLSALSPEAAAEVLFDAEERRVVQAEVVQRFASDTVAVLNGELQRQADALETAEERNEDLREELAETEGSFVALLADIWDQLGSAFGLWSVYFTVALTVTGGRTVGKKLLGIRVLRLDGEPLTWWSSFERAGGYAAGIATGTLGFVQIFWDANRQAVHDKIGGTVVVVDGAKPVPGAWEQAWRDQGDEGP